MRRRQFIAASAMGIFALSDRQGHDDGGMRARGGNREPGAGELRADEELLYVGAYTERDEDGIHLVAFDTRTGALRPVASVNAGPNPSFLAIHPDGRTLFAVNEVERRGGKAAGGVTAFAIAPDSGALTRINEQSSEGGAPCYVSVDRSGRVLLVANYLGGNVAVLPLRPTGAVMTPSQIVQHMGSGPNSARQEKAHAHFIATDPSNRFALAADLGVDRVLVYRLDAEAGTLQHQRESDGVLKAGAGPRHLAFHPRLPLVYVANELDSTVSTFRFDASSGALTFVESLSTLPAGWTGANYPADVHVDAAGRALYLSNRGHDSIAVFAVAEGSGALTLEQTVATGGDWPRNFSLDPTGRWLLVGNQRSASVTVFARDEASGRLTPTASRIGIRNPVCLRFRAHTGVTA